MPRRRVRLDLLLTEKGLFPTRAKAQAAILAGKVEAEGFPNPKSGTAVPDTTPVRVLPDAVPFVSRGGLKLAPALDRFSLRPLGRTAIDVGASTGGFTDCLLQRGAAKVFCVDVGHGQLDARLRADPRVVNMERCHAGRLDPACFGPPGHRPDLAVVDVSFISVSKILPSLLPCLRRPFEMLLLVKPQFELEPKMVPKGVVRNEVHRGQALERVRGACARLGLRERGFMDCPIKGPKGNVEFLLCLEG